MIYLFLKQRVEKLARKIEGEVKDSEPMAAVLRQVKESAPDETSDRHLYDRMFQKIIDAELSKARMQKISPRFFNLRRIVPAVGLAALLLAGLLAYGIVRSPSEDLIIKKALAAVEQKQTGKITYYKVTGYLTGMGKVNFRTSEIEYWIDNDSGVSKSIGRMFARDGGKSMQLTFIIGNNKTLMFEGEGDKVHVNESRLTKGLVGDDFKKDMTNARAMAEEYKSMLKDGETELIGKETIDGILTYKVRSSREIKAGKIKQILTKTANIRTDNYQPLKITLESEINEGSGSDPQTHSSTFVFKDVRYVDSGALAGNFFSMEIPSDADHSILETYSIAELKLSRV